VKKHSSLFSDKHSSLFKSSERLTSNRRCGICGFVFESRFSFCHTLVLNGGKHYADDRASGLRLIGSEVLLQGPVL
jgi:hypothetical protein